MTYLALDIGTRRIGAAVGNSALRLATPLTVIARSNLKKEAEEITRLAARYDTDALVIGLAREVDGAIGAQAQAVLAYAERLKREVELPIEFFDERYSTAAALWQRREIGVSEKRGRATLDAAAAAIILQDFLDALPKPEGTQPNADDAERSPF